MKSRLLLVLTVLLSNVLTLACRPASAAKESNVQDKSADDEEGLLAQCQDTSLAPSAKRPFRQQPSPKGSAMHSARDVLTREGQPILISGKFAYGLQGADLQGEEIDVYFQRACGVEWEKIGRVETSSDAGQNSSAGGSAGRVAFELSSLLKEPLGVGRYRLQLVVAGDHSSAELFIEVLAKNKNVILTDIDGVLTSSELAGAKTPGASAGAAYPGAADMLKAFYAKGYAIYYLSARPEWMTVASRTWLKDNGFPDGVVTTVPARAGLVGEAAVAYKKQELEQLRAKSALQVCYGFGSKSLDAQVFDAAGIKDSNSYFYMQSGDASGGQMHSDYKSLGTLAQAAPSTCL